MLIVLTILVFFKSPIRTVILLIMWLLNNFTIWVVVVNLESTFNEDNLMVENGTYINLKLNNIINC